MTAINYTATASSGPASTGYRGSYLTAYRTGDYGVYAFDSMNGQLEHIYAAGSPDAGVYIGECYPCNTVLDRHGQRAQRPRLLGHQLRRQPADRQLGVPQQPRRHRAQQRQLRAVLPAARDHHRRQHRVLEQPARHARDRRGDPGDGQRHPLRRRRAQRHRAQPRVRPRQDRHRPGAVPRGGPQRRHAHRGRVGHRPAKTQKQQPVADPWRRLLWDSLQNRVIGNVLERQPCRRPRGRLGRRRRLDVRQLLRRQHAHATTAPEQPRDARAVRRHGQR
jgi:hypothetical protein